MTGTTDQITQLIEHAGADDPRASDALFRAVYAELRKLATARLRAAGPVQTIQATELVHEAYMRLVERDHAAGVAGAGRVYEGRRHYFFAAARAIHDIVVERIRRRRTLKRGGDRARVRDAEITIAGDLGDGTRILEISDALDRLRQIDPDRAQLVLLRYFGGLSCEQIADMLDVSVATVNRRWRFARAWLSVALGERDVDVAHDEADARMDERPT